MIVLQNLLMPERRICTEDKLYYRSDCAAGFDAERGFIRLGANDLLTFDTYFNLFSLGKWVAACGLESLFLTLEGHGAVEVRVVHEKAGQAPVVVHRAEVTLAGNAAYRADLGGCLDMAAGGVLFLEITALADAVVIGGGRFETEQMPETLPRLAVAITTFRRERQVTQTIRRLEDFLQDFAFSDRIGVLVVDNGQSLDLASTDKVRVMANPNYGGAGGFARGLLEAEKAGFSHCLFMDDDATFHMENISRAYAFLALAKDPRTALAAAMINNTCKWKLWENGAVFDGVCRPLQNGTDLRKPAAVRKLEFTSIGRRQPTLYGGWWFFAFAIDQVRYYPFPFFVRGDDISFSLMNDFRICTLNGVVSFQEDFVEKESAQTLYLDLRNHLIHHMLCDAIARNALGTAKISLRFILRSLLRFHYETAEAQLLAWQDVMRGPGFFAENMDMRARRARIGEITENEVWRPVDASRIEHRRRLTRMPRRLRHFWGMWTLNGHLVPFSGVFGDKIRLVISKRALVFPAFGAAQITYINTRGDKGYTVRQSKRRFFRLAWQVGRTFWRWQRGFRAIKSAYREEYAPMTSRAFWEQRTGGRD